INSSSHMHQYAPFMHTIATTRSKHSRNLDGRLEDVDPRKSDLHQQHADPDEYRHGYHRGQLDGAHDEPEQYRHPGNGCPARNSGASKLLGGPTDHVSLENGISVVMNEEGPITG